jgi:hypothetical protein
MVTKPKKTGDCWDVSTALGDVRIISWGIRIGDVGARKTLKRYEAYSPETGEPLARALSLREVMKRLGRWERDRLDGCAMPPLFYGVPSENWRL